MLVWNTALNSSCWTLSKKQWSLILYFSSQNTRALLALSDETTSYICCEFTKAYGILPFAAISQAWDHSNSGQIKAMPKPTFRSYPPFEGGTGWSQLMLLQFPLPTSAWESENCMQHIPGEVDPEGEALFSVLWCGWKDLLQDYLGLEFVP